VASRAGSRLDLAARWVSRGGSVVGKSLPVPPHGISAGEKVGQRQAAAGTSRQWA
jgi:hypothetical protein